MLQSFITSIEQENLVVAFTLVLLSIIVNAQKLQEYMKYRKRVKINDLKEALNTGNPTGNTKDYLEQELESEYFKLVTNIRTEKLLREKIMDVHKDAKGEIEFFHFIRAISYLSIIDGKLAVTISKFAEFSYWYNKIAGITLMVTALVLWVFPIFAQDANLVKIVVFYLLGGMLVPMGFMLVTFTFPYESARKIEKYIAASET